MVVITGNRPLNDGTADDAIVLSDIPTTATSEFWRSSRDVPVIFSGPAVEPGGVATAVRSLDIAPTILHALGVPKRDAGEGKNALEGRVLSSVFSENGYVVPAAGAEEPTKADGVVEEQEYVEAADAAEAEAKEEAAEEVQSRREAAEALRRAVAAREEAESLQEAAAESDTDPSDV